MQESPNAILKLECVEQGPSTSGRSHHKIPEPEEKRNKIKNKMNWYIILQKYLLPPSYHVRRRFPHLTILGLIYVIFLDQGDISRCDISRSVNCARKVGLPSLSSLHGYENMKIKEMQIRHEAKPSQTLLRSKPPTDDL